MLSVISLLTVFGCRDISHKYENGVIMCAGNITNNLPEGEWVFFYDNADTCMKGKFEKGKRYGEWSFYYKNGNQAYKAKFSDDSINGLTFIYDTTGSLNEIGHIFGNRRQGRWYYIEGKDTVPGTYYFGEVSSALPYILCPCEQ